MRLDPHLSPIVTLCGKCHLEIGSRHDPVDLRQGSDRFLSVYSAGSNNSTGTSSSLDTSCDTDLHRRHTIVAVLPNLDGFRDIFCGLKQTIALSRHRVRFRNGLPSCFKMEAGLNVKHSDSPLVLVVGSVLESPKLLNLISISGYIVFETVSWIISSTCCHRATIFLKMNTNVLLISKHILLF